MEQEFSYQDEVHKIKFDADNEDCLKADSYKASIGEKEYIFNISKISDNSFSIILDGKSRLVYAAESDDAIFINLDGINIRLDKVGNDMKKFAQDDSAFGDKDKITTPMPGKIIKILVGEGDRIEEGQPLVIVESMKMENEIKSPTNGSVKSIHFEAGDLVNPDQPIIKLEPDEQ